MPNSSGPIQTFADLNQGLNYLQQKYGTVAGGRWEYLRYPFYSYQTYPVAGANQLNFFSQTVGGLVTQADTNMQTAGSFQGDWSLLVMSIGMKIRLKTNNLALFDGTDATTLMSDYLAGFVQTGVLRWTINSFNYLELPHPFLYAPPSEGAQDMHLQGNMTAIVSAPPWATLTNRRNGILLARPVLIETLQTFQIQLLYPAGAVPVIATGIAIDDTTNPLKVGVELDGILFRPVSS